MKTATDLAADLDAGRYLDGEYALTRPFVLGPGRPALLGNPFRRAKIVAPCTAILAGFVEPKPDPSMWRPDGGLRLTGPDGNPWRISFPCGSYSFPGRTPRSWAGLERLEITIDFALASYATAVPLFGSMDWQVKACPILCMVAGGRIAVTLRDSGGTRTYQANLAASTPGARNKVKITLFRGSIEVVCEGGTSTAGYYSAPLAENVDSVFTIGASAPLSFTASFSKPGDLTLYGFSMSFSPGPIAKSSTLPLTLPKPGDWWCAPDGILHDSSRMNDSLHSPPITIANVDVENRAVDRGGAGILIGYTQHGVTIRDTSIYGSFVGIGSMGQSYPIKLDNVSLQNNPIAAMMPTQCMVYGNHVTLNRSGRDSVCMRGAAVNLTGATNVVPGGSKQPDGTQVPAVTVFRLPPWPDPCQLNLTHAMLDHEGREVLPSEAMIMADAGGCRWGPMFRIAVRDTSIAQCKVFAKLIGNPKVPGAVLIMDNLSAIEWAPTIEATPAWVVTGKIDPLFPQDVPPGTVVNRPV